MKKSWKRLLAMLLAASLAFGDAAPVFAAEITQKTEEISAGEVAEENGDAATMDETLPETEASEEDVDEAPMEDALPEMDSEEENAANEPAKNETEETMEKAGQAEVIPEEAQEALDADEGSLVETREYPWEGIYEPVTLNQEYNHDFSEGYLEKEYYFVPEESGVYYINSAYSGMNVSYYTLVFHSSTGSYYDRDAEQGYVFTGEGLEHARSCMMEAGKIYRISVHAYAYNEEDSCTYDLQYAGENQTKELEIDGAEDVLSAGEQAVYRVTPPNAGFFILTLEGECETEIKFNWSGSKSDGSTKTFLLEPNIWDENYVLVEAKGETRVRVETLPLMPLTLGEAVTVAANEIVGFEYVTEENGTYYVNFPDGSFNGRWLDEDGQVRGYSSSCFYDSDGRFWEVYQKDDYVKKLILAGESTAEGQILIQSEYPGTTTELTIWSGHLTLEPGERKTFHYQGKHYGDYLLQLPDDEIAQNLISANEEIRAYGEEKIDGITYQLYSSGRSYNQKYSENSDMIFTLENYGTEEKIVNLYTDADFDRKSVKAGETIEFTGDKKLYGDSFEWISFTPEETGIYQFEGLWPEWLYQEQDPDNQMYVDRYLVPLTEGNTYIIKAMWYEWAQEEPYITMISNRVVKGNGVKFSQDMNYAWLTVTQSGTYGSECPYELWNEEEKTWVHYSNNKKVELVSGKSYAIGCYYDSMFGIKNQVTVLDYDYYEAFIASGGSVSVDDSGNLDIRQGSADWLLESQVFTIFGNWLYDVLFKEENYVKQVSTYWQSEEGWFVPYDCYDLQKNDISQKTMESGDVILAKFVPEIVWVDSMEVKGEKEHLEVGETAQIMIDAAPATSKYPFRNEPEYSYLSSDPEVVSVDENGVMTARKPGVALISVAADETLRWRNGQEDQILQKSFTVTVGDGLANVTVLDYDYYEAFVASGGSVSLDASGKLSIDQGTADWTLQSELLHLYDSYTYGDIPKWQMDKVNTYWKSSEGAFSPVQFTDLKGVDVSKETAVDNAVVLVKYEPEIVWLDSIRMEAEKDVLKIDETTQIKATPCGATEKYPLKKIPEVRFESENENIASVDQTGKVTAHAAGEVKIYAYATDPTDSKKEISESVQLRIRENPNSFQISYANLKGAADPEELKPLEYTCEDEVLLPKPTELDGYEFAGWYPSKEAADQLSGDTVTKIPLGSEGDKTFYAGWRLTTYEITYDLDGGTNTEGNPAGFTVEDTVILKAPEKTGYEFEGWYDAEGNKVTEISSGTTGNVTLKASWKAVTYQITYDLDEGTNAEGNPAGFTVEDTVILKNPERAGYEFEGWYDTAGNKVTEISKGITGDVILKASWKAVTYQIIYNLDGGTNAKENPAGFTVEDTVILKAPEKTGYEFEGWYDAEGNKVTEISSGTTGNVTLKASWKVVAYQITYDLDGGTNAEENPAGFTAEDTVKLKDPERAGYEFEGWYDAEGNKVTEISRGTTGNRTFYAKWTRIEYRITYEVNEGTMPEEAEKVYTIESKLITLVTPSRDGYTFSGWYENEDFSGTAVTEIPEGSTGNKTFYAKWTVVEYSIVYNVNGGEPLGNVPKAYTIESKVITLAAPNRDGYTFSGWYENEDFSGTAVTEIPEGSTGDKTFYAKWTAVEYSITYNVDGGELPKNAVKIYTKESETITLVTPQRADYTFDGWYTDKNFETEVTEIPSGSTGNIILYAKWTAVEYSIVYNVNGGKPLENAPKVYTKESETIELAIPERVGYTFDGWYTRESFGSKYKVTEIPKGSTGEKVFYAKWILDTYEINYKMDGGTFGDAYPISYDYESTVTLPNPVRMGYEFEGWFNNPEFEGSAVTKIIAGTLAENLTFYAKWKWDVTFEAALNEELLNISEDEDGNKTIILPYDADSESYNSVNVNVLLSAKQYDAPIGIHIPAEDIVIELYKGEYKENSKPDKESKGYDFEITEAEAGNATYTAVVKFDYDQKEERIEIPFKVATGKQPLPINKEVSWKGISNLEKGATFESIKDAVKTELLKGTDFENNETLNAGTVTFKNVKNESAVIKSGNYTVVYEVAENSQYFEKAEATVQITYNTFSQAGVTYIALDQDEVDKEGRIADAAAIAAPIESESGEINTTPYVSGVKIVPVFHTPWGDLDADELESYGYDVKVSANTVSGLSIDPTEDGNAVKVEASVVPKKTETRTIKLTSIITLVTDVDSELTDLPKVTITTTINNFKVFNGGSYAMKNIEYSFNEDDDVKKLNQGGLESYILEKAVDKRTFALDITATDYAGNVFASKDLKDKLTWTTSNKNVASVSVDSKTGIPTLSVLKNAQGVAEITATAKDAGKYSVSFRIVVADTDVRVETTKLTLNSKASEGIWEDSTQDQGEWGIIYLYPNIMAMDMYGDEREDETESVSKPGVTVELTDKEGKKLDDSIFELNDKSVASEGKLLIRFKEAQASKKNYTVYLKVTQKFSEDVSFSKDKIKVTISDQCSAPAISGKTSVNYNTALGEGYGYAEVLLTTAGTLSNLTLAEGSPFRIIDDPEFVGTIKRGDQYRVKLAFKEDLTEEQLADYTPNPNKTKKVNVKFEAAYEGYRVKALTGNISVTLTNIRPDFKLSTEQFKNPIFYKDQDMDLKQMRVYIDVPEGMTLDGTSIKLTESAKKYFEIVGNPEYIADKSQIAVTVKSLTNSNASIQFAITNENFYSGETQSKTLKTSGRSLTSESITLYDRITDKKAANSFTFYQSQLGKESINLYADSQYLAEILKINTNGNAKIEVQAADSAATKLLNKQALIIKEDGNDGICITATKDAFSNKSTSCKLKIFMSVSYGANTKNTKSQTITITFNPKAYDPSVTLKSSGSLNAANADAKVQVKATMKYLPAGSRIENVKFTSSADAKNFVIFKGMLDGSVTMEELLLREGGAFYISPADGAKIPSGKNTIGIAYDIRTVSGELITVNTSVAVNVVQTAKIKTSTSTVTLYNSVMGEDYGKSIVFTESVVNAPITVEILNQEELRKAGISIKNDDGAPNEEVQYKVYVDNTLSRGQEKTYTVKTKVILQNSATKKGEPITYNVNFKVKLVK